MRVLRDNKESLMAVLEAFVYDPLINWRLMPTKGDNRRPPGEHRLLRLKFPPSSHVSQVATPHGRQTYLVSMQHTCKNPFAN
jgi:phosphatidylinositol kinase/protein kinase (PI-3  family)